MECKVGCKLSESKVAEYSMVRSLSSRFISKKSILILGLVLMIAVTICAYRMDIDWEESIRTYGYPGIFFLSIISSMTVLLPFPGEAVLMTAPGILELSGVEVFWFAAAAGLGGTLGEFTGYLAGYWGGAAMVAEKKEHAWFGVMELWMESYGSWAVFIFALTPLPFDFIGIVAGTLRYPYWKFFVFAWAGRFIRALMMAYVGWWILGVLFW